MVKIITVDSRFNNVYAHVLHVMLLLINAMNIIPLKVKHFMQDIHTLLDNAFPYRIKLGTYQS